MSNNDAKNQQDDRLKTGSNVKEAENVTNARNIPNLPANTEKVIRVPANASPNENDAAGLNAGIPPIFSPDQLSNLNVTFAETMQNFALNIDPAFQDNVNYEELTSFFTSMSDQSDAIVPLLQEIIQNALTRQILYRPFRALLDKYVPWLADNEGRISNQELERYSEQKTVLQQLCDELMVDNDATTEPDENVRIEKTNRIMSLLYRMQDLGAPPEEVTRDIMLRIQFDEQGQPIIPDGININNLENLCTIM